MSIPDRRIEDEDEPFYQSVDKWIDEEVDYVNSLLMSIASAPVSPIASYDEAAADQFVEEVIEEAGGPLNIDDVVVFVDFHEDRARSGPTFVQALNSVEVTRRCWRVVQCRLHTGDVIIARVRAKSEDAAPDALGALTAPKCIDETVRVNGMPASNLLVDATTSELAAVVVYERKTIADLVSSIRRTSAVASDNHMQSELRRMLEFAARTGARPGLLLEGYMVHGRDATPCGTMNEDGVHSFLARRALEDGIGVWQSANVFDSARLCLKDARFIAEHRVDPSGWTRLGTGEQRSVAISVRKADNYDVDKWFLGILQSIPGMSSDRAQVVAATYPSVRRLISGYKRCASSRERRSLIADMRVASGKRQRLGPVLADRVEARFFGAEEESGDDDDDDEDDDDDDDEDDDDDDESSESVEVAPRSRPALRRAAARARNDMNKELRADAGQESSDDSSFDDDDAHLNAAKDYK